jgi:hypothetical protein
VDIFYPRLGQFFQKKKFFNSYAYLQQLSRLAGYKTTLRPGRITSGLSVIHPCETAFSEEQLVPAGMMCREARGHAFDDKNQAA